jgi:hypothetical protein
MINSKLTRVAGLSSATRATPPFLLVFALAAMLAGCEQRAPLVYVLESPQSITLRPSASRLSVRQGEAVVLHVERRTSGRWKQVARDQLGAGQCWVYRPPAEVDNEAADQVHWKVAPEHAVRFNTEYRMDHTRIATMMVKGAINLTPISAPVCEPDRNVEGPSLQIEVS